MKLFRAALLATALSLPLAAGAVGPLERAGIRDTRCHDLAG